MEKQKTQKELRELYSDKYVRMFENDERLQFKRVKGILEHVNLSANDVIGDFACGNGILSSIIHHKVKSCYGVDFSGEFIETAKRRAEKNKVSNVSYIEADIVDFCKDNLNFFDKIFTLDFSEHIYDQDFIKIYTSIYSSLKPGGILFLHTPNGEFLIEIFKNKGIMQQFPEHIAVRNAASYIHMLNKIGFTNIQINYISHYNNILRFLHVFSFLPMIGKFFKARLLITCSR